jgi:hypothetical protein
MLLSFRTLFLADFAETKIRKKRANSPHKEVACFLMIGPESFSELRRPEATFSKNENFVPRNVADWPPHKSSSGGIDIALSKIRQFAAIGRSTDCHRR